jgi:diguanylate cyclase (GGDEF)-like protein
MVGSMTGAPLPTDEYARLLDLASYDILDTPREAAFDRIARLAAHLLRTRVAVINFVDQDRQWGKAAVGLEDTTAPRQDSFCAWTILQDGPLVVENARTDPRFADNPMVVGEPHIHMYAGTPLTTPAGHRIGTLCVTDDRPHPLTPADLQALQDLAELAVSELELRARNLSLDRELGAQRRRNADLQRGLDHARVLEDITRLMDVDLSPEQMTLAASALLGEALAADYTGLVVFEDEGLRVQAAHHHPRMPAAARALPSELPHWPADLTQTLRGLTRPLYLDDYPGYPGALQTAVDWGIQQIAWLPLGTHGEVTSLLMAVRLKDNEVGGWRGSDRTLLEAAGRSVRNALGRRHEVELARQDARQDALTRVLNRRALSEDLPRREQLGAFLLAGLDLDGLKAVNDQEGHAQGDRLLQVFAATLKVELGAAGQLYRLGGDEFVVLGTGDEERVHEAVDTAVLAARQVAPFRGASVGVAYSHEASGDALLALADDRMYAVKRRRHAVQTGTGVVQAGA